MPRDRHPPKKKHPIRPRPPIVAPLGEIERKARAQQEFEKALVHLVEAERLAAWRGAPNACVHSAYYAMYHAATAALLAAGGVGKRRDVPKSHEHVIQHYGNLVDGEADPLGGSGLALNRARTDRMAADYDLVRGTDSDDAQETTRQARAMIEAVMKKWGFNGNVLTELND